ncbi:hypothetical protein SAY87_023489 [Trapa incisa]|uniref:Cyclin-dependent kinase inhibitor domain-containing protein n=2 Tax=Trapa TaxID=22665 RepID=A0AAN7QKE1_TRANT|nr:hypothetical protein SAY86_015380 [Trapa natans]KAK4775528.1 hypothetical protein SAY87_023489 [Trapa incisa]
MKKSKISVELSLSDISTRSTTALDGVCTRAKTLALRRLFLNSTINPSSNSFSSSSSSSASCYLELRSRRLRRPSQTPVKLRNQVTRPIQGPEGSPDFRSTFNCERDRISPACSRVAVHSGLASPASSDREEIQSSCEGHFGETTERGTACGASEEQTDRRTTSTMIGRLIEGDENFPGSPTALELDEFFGSAEEQQRQLFMEKYNFDVLTETPLRGPFQWVRVRP